MSHEPTQSGTPDAGAPAELIADAPPDLEPKRNEAKAFRVRLAVVISFTIISAVLIIHRFGGPRPPKPAPNAPAAAAAEAGAALATKETEAPNPAPGQAAPIETEPPPAPSAESLPRPTALETSTLPPVPAARSAPVLDETGSEAPPALAAIPNAGRGRSIEEAAAGPSMISDIGAPQTLPSNPGARTFAPVKTPASAPIENAVDRPTDATPRRTDDRPNPQPVASISGDGSANRFPIPNRPVSLAGAANATSGRAVSANNVAQNSGLPAASPSTGPARAAERSATRQHVVQRGENFWSIARTYYGSGSAYLALWYANRERVNSPEALAVGTSLRIPPMDELDRSMIEAVSTVAPNNARPKSAAAPAQPILSVGGRTDRNAIKPVDPSQRYHVVGASETLRSIARDELGDSSRELEIRRMNRDLLGESDRPQVGMRLRLPDETRRR